MEECRGAFKIVKSSSRVERLLGRPRRRLEDNIRMNLKEIGINQYIIKYINIRMDLTEIGVYSAQDWDY